MYRRGIVKTVDPETHRVRVTFPDRQNVESPWLDVIVQDTHGAKDYGLPLEGAQVAVIMDEHDEAGCVIGSVYSKVDAPTANDAKIRRLDAADGTRIEYDATKHELNVQLAAGATVNITGGVVNVGDDAVAVALAPKVANELAKVAAWKTHTHPTALGPSGPPTPALAAFEDVGADNLNAVLC